MALRIEESFHSGCPKHPSTRERIEAHLGRVREARPGEQAIELHFDVVRRGATSDGTLTLSLAGVSVERKASSKSCADVVAALSMMAAIAIGEETERLSSEPENAPVPADSEATKPSTEQGAETALAGPVESPVPLDFNPPSPAVVTATREQRPGRQNARQVALSFGTSVEVDGNRGALVMPQWFGQVTFPLPLDPTLRIGLARTMGAGADSPLGEATLRWTVLAIAGCANVMRTERLQLGPCLNGELGRLEATRVDPLPANKLFYFWPSLGASGRLAWKVTPALSLDLTIGVRAPLIARELYFNPDREAVVYRTPAIVPFVGAGVVVRAL
ncbi:hypothetical protein AKJ09_01990 [Labilithrix luteola]|uniref:Uncharacterized protein n=1 Tax=Labilithrix luteola TaxID=1391654 RepID=A0A0K1PPM1_9BACT|nr:hypothetical protein AKJ09_01990 [Labilithrix luteola]